MSLVADLNAMVAQFIKDLAQNKLRGSLTVSLATLQLIKRLIGQDQWTNADELLNLLKTRLNSREIQRNPLVGNLLRRVLKLIREEYTNALKHDGQKMVLVLEAADTQDSLHKMVVSDEEKEDFTRFVPDLKPKIIESLEELITELETSADEISNQALEHIHANEVIMTLGRSRTVELFLKQAAKERKFQVIIAECAPFFQGHEMAASLAKAKIQTTVITDSAVFAMMSRVNKVIIGTNAILANGGLVAVSGSYTVALSAKHYSVPLYVCSSMFKLTPQYANSSDQFNKFVSPQEALRGMEGEILSQVDTVCPVFEYVPPDLVTLFISNVSGHAPSYVYRLLGELYHQSDYDLQIK